MHSKLVPKTTLPSFISRPARGILIRNESFSWRSHVISFAPLFSFLASLLLVLPSAHGLETRRGDNIDLNGPFTDSIFAAGSNINASLSSTDDVFLAGGDIAFTGETTGNVFMAGGDLKLRDPKARLATLMGGEISIDRATLQDVILAGGEIRISESRIEDDVVLAAGSVTIARDTRIAGSLQIYGSDVEIGGQVGGDAKISGEDVELTGTFDGNLEVSANELALGPTAVIKGNLVHATRELKIAPGAQILGQTQALPVSSGGAMAGLALGGVLFALGLIVAPALIALTFPETMQRGLGRVHSGFVKSAGVGALVFFGSPVVLAILLATFIGIPVALFALPFLVVAGLLAWSITCFVIGAQVRKWLKRPEVSTWRSRFWWTLAGSLAASVVLFIPVLGILFCFILFLASLGSIFARFPARSSSATDETQARWSSAEAHA